MRQQHTLVRAVALNGFGFWSGQDVHLEFRPAPEDFGIRFMRTDLTDYPVVPALVEYRVDMPRQTSLARGSARFDMIEHVMAALAGHQIDNCEIRIDGPEMPGFDGSSRPFFEILEKAGKTVQPKNRVCRKIIEPIVFQFDKAQIRVLPKKGDTPLFAYSLEYDISLAERHPIGNQEFSFELTSDSFRRDVMSARTFLLQSEAEYLVSRGLCQRVSAKDVLVFGENGPLDNSLRFDNECARHKTLDMIGDFWLAGCDFLGEFHACRSGHLHNAAVVQKLLNTLPQLE